MLALKLVPDIHYFDTFKDFADEFKLGKGDILVTNEWMYKPYVEGLGLDMPVIYQEKYGAGEPTDEMMDAMKLDMDKYEYDRIIAFGGGTIVDCCKVLACEIPDKVADLYTDKYPCKKIKKLIAVPTTCGTGSEVTNVAVASLPKLGLKKGIATPDTFADEAVLIPESLQGLPDKVFATSSVDALIHAVESFLSPKASPFTEILSKEAIAMIMGGYKKIIERRTLFWQQIMPA